MLKLNRLTDMAIVVGDNVSDVVYVNWTVHDTWPITLQNGQFAFIIHQTIANNRQRVLVEQNYQSTIEITADILTRWPRYDNDIDFDNFDLVVNNIYNKIEDRSLYTATYQQISIVNDRSYFDRPSERFGITTKIQYKFIKF